MEKQLFPTALPFHIFGSDPFAQDQVLHMPDQHFYSRTGVGRKWQGSTVWNRRKLVAARRGARDFRRPAGATRRFQGGRRAFGAALNRRRGGLIGLELKWVDYEYDVNVATGVAASVMDDTTGASSLSRLAQGSGNNARDGRVATIKKISFQGMLRLAPTEDSASSAEGGMVTLALVCDKQCNNTAAVSSSVWDDPGDVDLDAFAFRKLDSIYRYNVVYKKTFKLTPHGIGQSAATTVTTGGAQAKVEFHIDMDTLVHYNGTAATVGDVVDNNYFLCAFYSNNNAPQPSLKGIIRVRFHA